MDIEIVFKQITVASIRKNPKNLYFKEDIKLML